MSRPYVSPSTITDVRYVQIRSGGPIATRTTYNSNYDFLFKLNEEIPNPRKICVTQAFFPFSWYNVDAYNKKITFNSAAPGYDAKDNKEAEIPEGNYTATTICTAIAAAMTEQDNNTYTVTISASTSKLNIVCTESEFRIKTSLCTCNELLGLPDATGAADLTSADKSLTFPLQVMLQPILCINIRAPGLVHSTETGTNNDLLYSYRVAATNGLYADYMDSNEGPTLVLYNNPSTLKEFVLSIVDQNGYSVDFQNMTRNEFFIMLKVEYERPRNLTF